MLDRFSHWLLRHRYVLLAFIFITSLPLIYLITNIRVDNTLEVWFEPDDPQLLLYKRFLDEFEGDQTLVVAFKAENIFTFQALSFIQKLTKELEKLPHVLEVISLTNVENIIGTAEGISIEPLIADIPTEASELSKIRQIALSRQLYVGNLISQDGKTTMIVLRVPKLNVDQMKVLYDAAWEVIQEHSHKYKLHLGGGIALDVLFDRSSTKDTLIFLPLQFFVVFLILIFVYRRITTVVLPFTVILLANVYTMGLFAILDLPFNIVISILPAIMVVIGIADSVHIITHYFEELAGGAKKYDAIILSIKAMFLPCLFTSLTTGIGFSSFISSHIVPIRTMGLLAAFGVMMAFIFTIVLLPIFLYLLKAPETGFIKRVDRGLLTRILTASGNFCKRNPRKIVVISILLAIVAGFGISRLQAHTFVLEFFKKGHPIRNAYNFLEENISGVVNLEIIIEDEPDFAKDPEFLRKVEGLTEYIYTFSNTSKVYSILDYLKLINQSLHADDPRHYRIPDTRSEVAQYLFLYELSGGEELFRYISSDYSTVRITAWAKTIGSKMATENIHKIQQYIDENFKEYRSAQLTGTSKMFVQLDQMIIQSQIRSFLIAFGIIFILLSVLFRSIKLGAIAMIPNVLPIAMTLAIMGLTHVPLDVATVMIAAVAIGITVDNTIHYMVRYNRELVVNKDYKASIPRTSSSVGRAIFFTSTILVLGFCVLIFASFRPTIYFGLLTGMTLLFGLIASMVLLPAILLLVKPFGKKKIKDINVLS